MEEKERARKREEVREGKRGSKGAAGAYPLVDLGKQEVALGDILGSATQQLNEEDK
jgi:hypothetical protein